MLEILVVDGEMACAMVFLSQEPSTKNGIIWPTLVFLAWIPVVPTIFICQPIP